MEEGCVTAAAAGLRDENAEDAERCRCRLQRNACLAAWRHNIMVVSVGAVVGRGGEGGGLGVSK